MSKTLLRGFSLIELMVVVAIIAIISGIVFINYSDSRMMARDGQRQLYMKDMAASLDLYRTSNFGLVPMVNTNWQGSFQSLITAGYITTPTVEVDPSPGRENEYTYTYCAGDEGHKFLLVAFLEKAPGTQSLVGPITSYTAGQCAHQGGVMNAQPFAHWQQDNVCGSTLANGLHVYCLGSL